MPKYWVTRARAVRSRKIEDGFPDSLDMMLVCVEAGQSLDQSILRVSKEIRAGFPALAEEFEIVANRNEGRQGQASVLKDMAERCGVSDISSLRHRAGPVAVRHLDRRGAARLCREMRDKRVMRAEEKGQQTCPPR